jgi:hypothetical protein
MFKIIRIFTKVKFKMNPCDLINDLMTVLFDIVQLLLGVISSLHSEGLDSVNFASFSVSKNIAEKSIFKPNSD